MELITKEILSKYMPEKIYAFGINGEDISFIGWGEEMSRGNFRVMSSALHFTADEFKTDTPNMVILGSEAYERTPSFCDIQDTDDFLEFVSSDTDRINIFVVSYDEFTTLISTLKDGDYIFVID